LIVLNTKAQKLVSKGFEDCEDENAMINPAAEDIPNNGIAENSDGEVTVASTNYL
jgi:hypothetical protein